jgi:hypothetical protein
VRGLKKERREEMMQNSKLVEKDFQVKHKKLQKQNKINLGNVKSFMKKGES